MEKRLHPDYSESMDQGSCNDTSCCPPMEPVRNTGKVGRNDPCPCGSRKKYKKCCLAR